MPGSDSLSIPEAPSTFLVGDVHNENIHPRSPRDFIPFPDQEIELQPPPNLSPPPNVSLVSILLPIGGAVLSIVISLVASMTMYGGAIPIFIFVSMPMMLFSVLGGLYNYFNGKNKYQEAVKARIKDYTIYLSEKSHRLEKLHEAQREASLIPNPAPKECFERAKNRDLRLWERAPNDPDFLSIRIGTGHQKPTYTIKFPESIDLTNTLDPLILETGNVIKRFNVVKNVATQLKLNDINSAGIVGTRTNILPFMRSLLVQLSTQHAPEEVKIILVLPEKELSEWRWARWLPHVWDSQRENRMIVAGEPGTQKIMNQIDDLLKDRENLQLALRTSEVPLPAYIVVFADPDVWKNQQAVSYRNTVSQVLTKGPSLGFFSLFVGERVNDIRKECGAVITIDAQDAEIRRIGPKPTSDRFIPDFVDCKFAESFARILAPVRSSLPQTAENIPSRVTPLDLFGVDQINAIDMRKNWSVARPYDDLSFPIGRQVGNKIQWINLQEQSKKGFGSHALVGGTTGTGKTEFLRTLVVLVCAHYRPDDVNFVLVDYKGGDLAKDLEGLPHLVGSLANIETQATQSELIDRLFKAIEAEIQRRKQILKGSNINDYMDAYIKSGRAGQPLPHLFFIIDEFAELVRRNPSIDPENDLVKKLISIGAIGRSIGIHLILATQSPGTVVRDELRENVNTRICLRMGSAEASNQILRLPYAYDRIRKNEVGRAYIQVGSNDVFEKIQVAWGGASSDNSRDLNEDLTIREVTLDGLRINLSRSSITMSGDASPTQIEALVKMIKHTAVDLKIPPQTQVWTPLLPERLLLEELEPGYLNWTISNWTCTGRLYNPIIGKLDNPELREQNPLRLNFAEQGNLVIFGVNAPDRYNLLQTLITELVTYHSPKEVEIYGIDFGDGFLRLFESLPHVGSVISSGDTERLHRLLSLIRWEVDSRKRNFSVQTGSAGEAEVKRLDSKPEIFIIVENYSAYVDTYKSQVLPPEIEALNWIAREGKTSGVHLVISNDTVKSFPEKIKSTTSLIIALELNNTDEYLLSTGKGRVPTRGIPGRGVIKGTPPLEFQTALTGIGDTPHERRQWLRDLYIRMDQAWGTPRPRRIPVLPDIVELSSVNDLGVDWSQEVDRSLSINIGIDLGTPGLEPVAVSFAENLHYWIAGPQFSGKTTLVQSWLIGLAEKYPPGQLGFCIFDFSGGSLSWTERLDHTRLYLPDLENINLSTEIDKVKKSTTNEAVPKTHKHKGTSATLIVINGMGQLKQIMSEKQHDANRQFLIELLRLRSSDVHIIASGLPQDFSPVSNPIGEGLRHHQSGFLLGQNTPNDISFTFNLKLKPEDSKRQMTPGMAFFVQRSNYRVLKLITYESGNLNLEKWVERIQSKYSN